MRQEPLVKNLMIQIFEYSDGDIFNKCYAKMDSNFEALSLIWTSGMQVIIVLKKRLLKYKVVGFSSLIDCAKLREEERAIMRAFKIPNKFKGLFINDFRIAELHRRKRIGTALAQVVLNQPREYLLEAVEDGIVFWPSLGFEYYNKKLMILDKTLNKKEE